MNIVETDYWCLMLPLEWSAQQDDGVVSITDQDGIGELALTTLVKETGELGANTEAALTELVALESPEVKEWTAARFGAFTGLAGRFRTMGTKSGSGTSTMARRYSTSPTSVILRMREWTMRQLRKFWERW